VRQKVPLIARRTVHHCAPPQLSALDRKRGKGGQQVVRVERVVVHEGGQAIVGNVKGGDTPAVTKPAAPLAVRQEQSGLTLDDLVVGKQPELVGEGV
jgi:hypothetical protein